MKPSGMYIPGKYNLRLDLLQSQVLHGQPVEGAEEEIIEEKIAGEIIGVRYSGYEAFHQSLKVIGEFAKRRM